MTRRWGILGTAFGLALAGAATMYLRATGVFVFGCAPTFENGAENPVRLLLMLPAGVLLTAFVRLVLGFPTFGTFAPSLLAIGLVVDASLQVIVVLIVALGAGLAGRAVFARLRLLFAARMGLVLTLVATGVGLASATMGGAPPSRMIVLPVLILTMVVEHFYVAAERDGYRSALLTMGTTFATAAGCLFLFRAAWMEAMASWYPDNLLFAASLLVLVGSYRGYRLTELVRFRWIGAGGEGRDYRQ
jgi:hypothetical protein